MHGYLFGFSPGPGSRRSLSARGQFLNTFAGIGFSLAFSLLALGGYLILTYNYDLEFGGREGMLTDFFIAPRYRRRGLGAQMIAAVREFCRAGRIGTIELQVTRENRSAQAFYRALGFKTWDRIVMSIEAE